MDAGEAVNQRDLITARRERDQAKAEKENSLLRYQARALQEAETAMIVYGFEHDDSKLRWRPSPYWAMRRDDDHASAVALQRAEIEIQRLTKLLERELWRVRDLNEELDIAAKEIAVLKARLMP